jgi:hypothetical protein
MKRVGSPRLNNPIRSCSSSTADRCFYTKLISMLLVKIAKISARRVGKEGKLGEEQDAELGAETWHLHLPFDNN